MQRLWAGLVLAIALGAAEPNAEDQAAMQEVLRRYLRGVNDCDAAAAKAAITSDFTVRGLGTGGRLSSLLQTCDGPKPAFEITALARILNSVTSDVVNADAFFRTVGMPGGEQAGRLYITFARRDGAWRIFSLRFHPYTFERPLVSVIPATHHDPAGPDGWVTLFDGSSIQAFQDASGAPFPDAWWKIDDASLRAVAGKDGRALRTKDTYRSFELRFEWKAAQKTNSGIKYRLFYLVDVPNGVSEAAGFEYQIADDNGDPGAMQHPSERSGSLYNQIAAHGAVPKPLGEYNQSVIIVRGRRCEHWLNGVKVVEFEADANPPESPVMIQHHTTEVWFRNMRIRRLDD